MYMRNLIPYDHPPAQYAADFVSRVSGSKRVAGRWLTRQKCGILAKIVTARQPLRPPLVGDLFNL
jgi:hypothetical protein